MHDVYIYCTKLLHVSAIFSELQVLFTCAACLASVIGAWHNLCMYNIIIIYCKRNSVHNGRYNLNTVLFRYWSQKVVDIKNIKSNAPYPNTWRWQVFFRLNCIGKSVSIWMEIQLKQLIWILTNWDAGIKTLSANPVYLNIVKIVIIIIIISIIWRKVPYC